MSFEIQTTSSFDAETKRLAKRHRSFIDDLQDFQKSLLANFGDNLAGSTALVGDILYKICIASHTLSNNLCFL